MPTDDSALLDIAAYGRRIAVFTQGMDRTAFFADVKTQAAVIHHLLIMGEAVKRLSPEFRAAHPSIPWADIAGMRDWLIHGYDRVNLSRVWTTV
jgi:uncharacterized protein with HEPN domain